MKFIFSFIGGIVGLFLDFSFLGLFFGVAIGFIFSYIHELKKNLIILEKKISGIQSSLITNKVGPTETAPGVIQKASLETKATSISKDALEPEEKMHASQNFAAAYTEETITKLKTEKTARSIDQDKTDSRAIDKEHFAEKLIGYIKHFFTSGNVVVKVGVIILFFGVAFLLKYAAQKNAFPIELRLVAVAVGGIGMLIFGWRLRHSESTYALILQGGAVGILYLTVFSAAKLYTVLPLGFTFLIMLALVAFSCLLAVIQNSRSLACFAIIGGFLAPVLTSSGDGNHIALFSYYAILNAGIFGIAWFKTWRILNWLGFVFTFVIASLWGYDSYQAEHFKTTEPFLILFFLYYLAISILFAYKQPPHLKGLVDGSLVFGVPLIGFTLQSLLVSDYEFGQALSAFGMGAIYIFLARWLWNKQIEGMRLLTESFLALGVIFGSLAIPFALDGHWTATIWALEGAGICWIGIRQQRLFPRLFGILLQVAGGLIFLNSSIPITESLPILNSAYMGAFILSTAGLFSAFMFYKHKQGLSQFEQQLHWLLLTWALLWWFGSGLIEISEYVSVGYESNAALFFITMSMLALALIARSLDWKGVNFISVLLLPVMYLITFIHIIDTPSSNILSNYGFISWIATFTVQMFLLYRSESIWGKKLLSLWHSLTLYLFVFLCSWIIANFVSHLLPDTRVWADIVWGLVPAFGILMLIYLRDRISWPIMRHPQSYIGKGLLPIVIYLGLWVIIASLNPGNPDPLPYITVFNPLELAQLFGIIIILKWLFLIKNEELPKINFINVPLAFMALGAIVFIWISSVVAHSVHYYAGVNFNESAMLSSGIFQTSISIVWALTAFLVMWFGRKKLHRYIWFAGAFLLGIVVVKLFLVDLAGSETVTRIVSFMTVGLLMLAIGYFSPMPPKKSSEQTK